MAKDVQDVDVRSEIADNMDELADVLQRTSSALKELAALVRVERLRVRAVVEEKKDAD